MTTYIYVLRDPRTGNVRYVGKTTDPAKRLRAHLRSPSGRHLAEWISELRGLALAPSMCVVELCGDEWEPRERRWIKRLRDRGVPLVNATRGGRGERYARTHWIDPHGVTRFPTCV